MSLFKRNKTVTTAPRTTKEVFERAAAIVRNKWTQGEFVDAWGGQCLVQAIATAGGIPNMASSDAMLPREYLGLIDAKLAHNEDYREARELASACNSTADGIVQHAAIRWNDRVGRTRSEVVGLLESIARDLAKPAAAPDELQQMSDELDRLWDAEQKTVRVTTA